ncbi:hypothetical protein Btru_049978 [Bulinus truncatus]|nr:hypothetical protein Btru_049978 [Bulinus truncatus]
MANSPDVREDFGYEEAVKALLELQSNAEVIAKIRQTRDLKKTLNIPNMLKYIARSGLEMEKVENLSVIHVSGTKGKGSTCAFCERILHGQGYKTGLFTSPHLIEVRERIRLNGSPISKELFGKYFWKVYSRLKATQTGNVDEGGGMPAYFAFLTVLSLHVFISEHVDVAVVEVGIGGQYDSTNFFQRPVVCGVTSLGLDHTALLGNTIEEIAWNKAGIFKKGRPAITVPQESKAMKVLQDRSVEIQNPLYIAKPMAEKFLEKSKISLGISGNKQIENASLAIQLCRFWQQSRVPNDMYTFSIPVITTSGDIPVLTVDSLDDSTGKGLRHLSSLGLSSCVWPGRAQTLKRESITYYLDGAHTLESMEVCATWFKNAADKERRSLSGSVARVLIFNSTGDRDVLPFLKILKECEFDAAVFCTNTVSTSGAFNRADQINRTVTPESMVHRAQANKGTWDSLPAFIRPHQNQNDRSCVNQLDHNCNNKDLVDRLLKQRDYIHRDVNFVSHDQNCFQDGPSYPHHNCIPSDKNKMSHFQDAVILACNGVLNTDCSRDVKQASYIFPSILEALSWATQGRDLVVKKTYSSSGTLPAAETFLKEKGHVQILVTGSLHLVGGVLGIITPDMND